MSYNILVLDDEKEIADLVELSLSDKDFHIYKYNDSKEAINCINTVKLDMAILDVMLPVMHYQSYHFLTLGNCLS